MHVNLGEVEQYLFQCLSLSLYGAVLTQVIVLLQWGLIQVVDLVTLLFLLLPTWHLVVHNPSINKTRYLQNLG